MTFDQMSNSTKAVVMATRVGLPGRTGTEIFLMALRCAARSGLGRPNMVLVANAIKYAADNKDQLKPQWRVMV